MTTSQKPTSEEITNKKILGKEAPVADVNAENAPRQNALRLSINPTYDSRKTGSRYWVDSFVGDRLVGTQHISDPFIRTTVKVGLFHAIRSFLRFGSVKVQVCVTGHPSIMEDVLELDANYIGHGNTRRAEWNASIESALVEHSRKG